MHLSLYAAAWHAGFLCVAIDDDDDARSFLPQCERIPQGDRERVSSFCYPGAWFFDRNQSAIAESCTTTTARVSIIGLKLCWLDLTRANNKYNNYQSFVINEYCICRCIAIRTHGSEYNQVYYRIELYFTKKRRITRTVGRRDTEMTRWERKHREKKREERKRSM